MTLSTAAAIPTAIAMALVLANAVCAQDAGELSRGREVARVNCSTCHAISRNEQNSPDPNAPPFQRTANSPGMTSIALNHLMHSAHRTMPLIILSPGDQRHLIAYILSLRSGS